MERIKILDKEFDVFISSGKIQKAVRQMSDEIYGDYHDKTPVFLCLLNGVFMFAADLFKAYNGNCEVSFIKYASYEGTSSTGRVNTLIGLGEDLTGRDLIVLDDIVDSGTTMAHLLEFLKELNPTSIKVASLLLKPAALQKKVQIDYIGLEIPNDFIVGYGLDYNGLGRNYRDIYKIVE
ncbi:MAG: hypoxanthine phosphoribosyltransferase [Bacteroidales bacterium]